MPRQIKYTKELLEPIAQKSKSITDIIYFLNLVPKGGNYNTIKRNLEKFNIDCSHFSGQGWSKGYTKETHKSIAKYAEKIRKYTIETGLIRGTKLSSTRVRELSLKAGLQYKCQDCGIDDNWNNKKLVLHLDHINGINTDNRIENLRFLCPNCHSQTETYCSKNLAYQETLN